jgi:PAS domain S-box-containing protein
MDVAATVLELRAANCRLRLFAEMCAEYATPSVLIEQHAGAIWIELALRLRWVLRFQRKFKVRFLLGSGKKVRANSANIVSLAAIVVVSALFGTFVWWRAPGIDQYMRDWMVQARGPLPPPDDIAIVAIDEPSIARFGRFPWPRALSARAIDAIAAAQPRAIGMDVLYVDPTSEADDGALAHSIQQAGNVVVAAQLVAAPANGGTASWLLPLPAIEGAAAAVGHVNVSTESDGIARQILMRVADDRGRAIRAMAVEIIRIGDGISDHSLLETSRRLLLGSHIIPVETSAPSVVIGVQGSEGKTQTLPAARMTIDYIGPAGSYRTYSLADVLSGRIPPVQFRGKYVLVGATAASLGDRLASPFIHQADAGPNQHGSLMPGVEVLANTLNTILRSRFFSETPDWLAFLCGALVAALTLFLLTIAQGRYETVKQIAALAGVAGAVLVAAYLAFTRALVFPPLTLSLVSFASAGVLGLLRRSWVASSHLDKTIKEIQRAGESLNTTTLGSAAESIARLADAEAVAIYTLGAGGSLRLVAAHGIIPRKGSGGFALPEANYAGKLLTIPIEASSGTDSGMVVIAHAVRVPSIEIQQLCAAIAGSLREFRAENEESSRWWWPRGLAWKARSLGHLNGRILDHAKFVDLAMRSVEDALIIAGVDGRITFANRSAASVFDTSERALRGRDLLELLAEAEQISPEARSDVLVRLVVDRASIEREIIIRRMGTRHFTLRVAAVCSGEDRRGTVRGIVASLSDITRQHELQQTKNDVMALVSHEMRTPLTAIQGMSELLAQFEFDPERSREMSIAIHDEAKRLTHMISQYLDITRLESGATVLRRSAVRIEALVERTLLMLDPLASKRGILLRRDLDSNVTPAIADADLLSRAISNLVSNAVKYSPPKTEVVISARNAANGVAIEVADHGYGIPEDSLNRIFEKFYRVPRVQDVDVPGTGLGLALVREIAELHGGSVAAQSSVGIGSTFTLWLPCSEGKT